MPSAAAARASAPSAPSASPSRSSESLPPLLLPPSSPRLPSAKKAAVLPSSRRSGGAPSSFCLRRSACRCSHAAICSRSAASASSGRSSNMVRQLPYVRLPCWVGSGRVGSVGWNETRFVSYQSDNRVHGRASTTHLAVREHEAEELGHHHPAAQLEAVGEAKVRDAILDARLLAILQWESVHQRGPVESSSQLGGA